MPPRGGAGGEGTSTTATAPGMHRQVLLRPSPLSIICDSLRLGEEALARAQESAARTGATALHDMGGGGGSLVVAQQDGGGGLEVVGSGGAGGGSKEAPVLKLSSEERSNIESQV